MFTLPPERKFKRWQAHKWKRGRGGHDKTVSDAEIFCINSYAHSITFIQFRTLLLLLKPTQIFQALWE